jgi:hypothetical protein
MLVLPQALVQRKEEQQRRLAMDRKQVCACVCAMGRANDAE